MSLVARWCLAARDLFTHREQDDVPVQPKPQKNLGNYFDNVRLRRILTLFLQPAAGRAGTIDEVFGYQLSGLFQT